MSGRSQFSAARPSLASMFAFGGNTKYDVRTCRFDGKAKYHLAFDHKKRTNDSKLPLEAVRPDRNEW